MDELKKLVIAHEGLKLKAYRCTANKLTIGVGRNLDDCGISKDEALIMLDNDLAESERYLKAYDWWRSVDRVRQEVLIELCFNIGIAKILQFKNMIKAIHDKDFENAAKHMLDSAWAKQVGPTRSNNMAARMRNGSYAS